MRLFSPAKINLLLNVHKRTNSLHPIESLMHFVSLRDELIFEKRKDGRIQIFVDGEFLLGEESRIRRTLEYLRNQEKIPSGMTVWVRKKIPAGSGLGGGSGNAASALIAAQTLWQARIPPASEVALAIGSDVPFFLSSGCAWVSGVGEKIESMPCLPPFPCIILFPEIPLSSEQVYQWWDEEEKERETGRLKDWIQRREWKKVLTEGWNALEEVVVKKIPKLKQLQSIVEQTSPICVRMTGSGSSYFAIYETEKEAEQAFFELEKRGICRVFWSRLSKEGIEVL